MRRRLLSVMIVWLAALPLTAAVTTERRGEVVKPDAELIRFFIKKAALYGKYKRYEEIPLELKTAERILNDRSKKLAGELALAYLDAAQGYLFYFEYPNRKKEAYLTLAELCLRSAQGLDPSLYGQTYRFLLALKQQRGRIYYAKNDQERLARLKKEFRSLRESTGEITFKQKIIKYKEDQRKRAIRKKQSVLDALEARFVQELKRYKTAFIQSSVTVYRPFLAVINTILQTTPRPPGGTYFLHQLMKEHHCQKEVMEVLRKRKR